MNVEQNPASPVGGTDLWRGTTAADMVDELAGGDQAQWRAAASRAVALIDATVGWDDRLAARPEQGFTARVLSLVVYAVARQHGTDPAALPVSRLSAWTGGIGVDDASRLGEPLAELLRAAGHDAPPGEKRLDLTQRSGHRTTGLRPEPTDPVARLWCQLVDWIEIADVIDGSDWRPGPNLGWGLMGAVEVINAARAGS